MIVDRIVLPGSCCVTVNVLAGSDKTTVLAASCCVLVTMPPDKVKVENIVLAGSAEITVLIRVEPGKVTV